jgi:biopolymer transport protein ExbB
MKNLFADFSPMVFLKRTILLAAALFSFGAAAQDLENLASGANGDLQKAMAELTAARQEVEAERLPLARHLTELEQKLAERKAEFAKAQRFQENQLVELNALKTEAKLRSEEVKYIDSLVSEYARAFHSRLSFIEEPRQKEMFEAVEKTGAAPDLSAAEKFRQRSVLFEASLKRSEAALGGELFDGKALDKQGRIQEGKVALIGPVAAFASASGDTAGLLQQELNRADPTVMQVDKKLDAASRTLVTTGSGELVLDPTLGNAFKLAALHDNLASRLAKGGLIMIPLLGLGLAVVLIALVKWFQLLRTPVATEADLQRVLTSIENGERENALAQARRIPGLSGDLLATAIQHVDEKKEYIEEIVYEKMLGARTKLERGIHFLALAATTGPLMGLLGTVMGMIATFKVISSSGSGDPKMLAAGISEALICTATGMAVAIPALLFHAFLSRRAKGIIGSMEQTAVGFINGIPESEKSVFN